LRTWSILPRNARLRKSLPPLDAPQAAECHGTEKRGKQVDGGRIYELGERQTSEV